MRCSVIGAGAWGTALADLLSRNGHRVTLWAYEPDVVQSINERHENTRFLAGHALSSELRAVSDIAESIADAELITVATPSQVLRPILRSAAARISSSTPVVVASKGIEKGTLCLMTDVVSQELTNATVVALSGPSFGS